MNTIRLDNIITSCCNKIAARKNISSNGFPPALAHYFTAKPYRSIIVIRFNGLLRGEGASFFSRWVKTMITLFLLVLSLSLCDMPD